MTRVTLSESPYVVYAIVDVIVFFVIFSWFQMVADNYLTFDGVTKGEGLILLMVTAISLLFASKPFVRGMSTILEAILSLVIETEYCKRLLERFKVSKVSSDIKTEE